MAPAVRRARRLTQDNSGRVDDAFDPHDNRTGMPARPSGRQADCLISHIGDVHPYDQGDVEQIHYIRRLLPAAKHPAEIDTGRLEPKERVQPAITGESRPCCRITGILVKRDSAIECMHLFQKTEQQWKRVKNYPILTIS